MKSLFLAWQAPENNLHSRAWFPVGRLDAEPESGRYSFRYTQGALKAQQNVGFSPLLSFPKLDEVYESSDLFPLFQNRVLSPKRRDFKEYVQWLNLESDQQVPDPIEILSVSGGERQTDSMEVFPKVNTDSEGYFKVRFFLHGLRHLGEKAIARATKLVPGEQLRILMELNNPATRIAVPLLTEDYSMIGWAPRYLVEDLVRCLQYDAPELSVKVAKVNPEAAPFNQRILIDYTGRAPGGYEPMTTPDFQPLLKSNSLTPKLPNPTS